MKATDLLMKYEEYRKLQHKTPYNFVMEKNGQYLYYFGERHFWDPAEKQFNEIESFWNEFLEKTKKKNCVALIEGGEPPVAKSSEEAILKYGGPGFLTWLSSKSEVKSFSPEPPGEHIFSVLEKHFPKEAIEYYFFARVCYQWNKLKEKPSLESYVEPFLKQAKRESKWKDFDFTIEHMKKIHEDLFHTKFNETDKDFFYKVINPTTTFSIVNKVSRMEDEGLRDVYIVEQIEKLWSKGKNIFILYGASHAVVQEEALRYLVGKKGNL